MALDRCGTTPDPLRFGFGFSAVLLDLRFTHPPLGIDTCFLPLAFVLSQGSGEAGFPGFLQIRPPIANTSGRNPVRMEDVKATLVATAA